MTVLKMKKIDLFRKANAAQTIQEDFEIIVNEDVTKMRIAMPDIFTILGDQKKAYAKELASCISEGLGEYTINEDELEKGLVEIKDKDAKEEMIKNKPKNLAEQLATELSRIHTIRTLIPKILRDPDNNNELICQTKADRDAMGDYLSNN